MGGGWEPPLKFQICSNQLEKSNLDCPRNFRKIRVYEGKGSEKVGEGCPRNFKWIIVYVGKRGRGNKG